MVVSSASGTFGRAADIPRAPALRVVARNSTSAPSRSFSSTCGARFRRCRYFWCAPLGFVIGSNSAAQDAKTLTPMCFCRINWPWPYSLIPTVRRSPQHLRNTSATSPPKSASKARCGRGSLKRPRRRVEITWLCCEISVPDFDSAFFKTCPRRRLNVRS